MDGEHLVYPEGLGVLPGEDPVFRQYTGIVDGAVSIAVRMDVIVVGHHHIHAALPLAFLSSDFPGFLDALEECERQGGVDMMVTNYY